MKSFLKIRAKILLRLKLSVYGARLNSVLGESAQPLQSCIECWKRESCRNPVWRHVSVFISISCLALLSSNVKFVSDSTETWKLIQSLSLSLSLSVKAYHHQISLNCIWHFWVLIVRTVLLYLSLSVHIWSLFCSMDICFARSWIWVSHHHWIE